MPKRKRLSASQKAQVVLEAIREDKSVALIGSENNIHPNQIHKWKKQALEGFVHLFENDHQSERAKEVEHEKQVDELYAEIGRLSAQLSWLKKNLGTALSRAERLAMLEKDNPQMPLKTQVELLGISYSSLFYQAVGFLGNLPLIIGGKAHPNSHSPENNIPPPYGEHYSVWQNCGIYDQPVELGNAIHSLEHGAVWLSYSLVISESQVADLQKFARGHAYVLMSPYPNQPAPVVLTAWGVQLIIESLPDERIEKFIAYYENGPQNPEPGAPCSGAVGEPLP